VALTQQVKGVGKHRRKHLNCPLAEGYPIDMAACETSCRKEILMTSTSAALYGSRKRQFRPQISCGRVYCRFSRPFNPPSLPSPKKGNWQDIRNKQTSRMPPMG